MHSNEIKKDSSPPFWCACAWPYSKNPQGLVIYRVATNVADVVLDRAIVFLKQENYVSSEVILSLEAERAEVLAASSK